MTILDVANGQSVDPLWTEGWYRLAARQQSPNFGPRPLNTLIDLIVLHSISLPPGKYGGTEVAQLFANQLDWRTHPYFTQLEGLKVSAHFFIRRTGELWQFVSCHDRAWHAGESFYRGKSNCNDDSIGIELEGLEGDLFETEQYVTLNSLCSDIMQAFPIAHIAGHQHIAPGRKADPGAGFDWHLLNKNLRLPPQCLPVELRPICDKGHA